jgi:hypothetical protein
MILFIIGLVLIGGAGLIKICWAMFAAQEQREREEDSQ